MKIFLIWKLLNSRKQSLSLEPCPGLGLKPSPSTLNSTCKAATKPHKMALFTLSKKLPFPRIYPQFFLTLLLRPVSSHSLQTLSHTFPRTPLYKPRFSVPRHLSTQTLYDPFDLIRCKEDVCDPLKSGLPELLKRLEGLSSEAEVMAVLDGSGVEPNQELVYWAIWGLREDWRLAYWVFNWGEKWGCNSEGTRGLVIWILGNCKKFGVAWCLIRELHRSSVDTRRAMLIMIDR